MGTGIMTHREVRDHRAVRTDQGELKPGWELPGRAPAHQVPLTDEETGTVVNVPKATPLRV